MNIRHFFLKFFSVLILIQVGETFAKEPKAYELQSPDRKTVAQFKVEQGHLYYRLSFNSRQILTWSQLGLAGANFNLVDQISINDYQKHRHKETFDWPLGEDAKIENNYRSLILKCSAGKERFDIVARVYNGSFAFRYVYRVKIGSPNRIFHVNKELTAFNLAAPARIYQYHEESIFRPMQIDQLPGISDLPSTLVMSPDIYLSIGEAENRNFTKSVLERGGGLNDLRLHFYVDTLYRNHQVVNIRRDSDLVFKDSLRTPWRTISCSTSAAGLHDFSQLNIKLTDSLNSSSINAVKPGKVFRVPISTSGALTGIDFAQHMNFQYILVDAGWYGAEFRTTSDPLKPIAGFDVEKIVNYGKSKGIGVILYVNYVGLRAKLDSILPLYKKWGVAGLKFGFVDGGSQEGLTWLDTAMQKVNDYGMVLNVHDHYKPTGLSRRYPFNLSQEGIRGDENSPDAFHNMVLPFTRYLAGAGDFTFCYPNTKNSFSKNLLVSKGQQIALSVIYFDPLQAIFWYGRSDDYQINDEMQFFRQVPTVWDKTIYLKGEIGEFVSVARKKKDVWFIGSATGFDKWNGAIDLDFLDKRREYIGTVYSDDGKGSISIKTITLKKGQHIPLSLPGRSGQAIIIKPL